MTLTKRKLAKLQRSRKFVFHGSELKLQLLKPRQAYDIVGGRRVKDGKPAVFASPFVAVAIFMAIINRKNCSRGFRSGFSYRSRKLSFRASHATLDQLRSNAAGYVYVFHKKDFIRRNPCEVMAFRSLKPLKIIKVSTRDLPKNITVIKS